MPKSAEMLAGLHISSLIAFFQGGNCSKMNPDDSPISGIDSNPAILPGK
jgi:hypothetical protein